MDRGHADFVNAPPLRFISYGRTHCLDVFGQSLLSLVDVIDIPGNRHTRDAAAPLKLLGSAGTGRHAHHIPVRAVRREFHKLKRSRFACARIPLDHLHLVLVHHDVARRPHLLRRQFVVGDLK